MFASQARRPSLLVQKDLNQIYLRFFNDICHSHLHLTHHCLYHPLAIPLPNVVMSQAPVHTPSKLKNPLCHSFLKLCVSCLGTILGPIVKTQKNWGYQSFVSLTTELWGSIWGIASAIFFSSIFSVYTLGVNKRIKRPCVTQHKNEKMKKCLLFHPYSVTSWQSRLNFQNNGVTAAWQIFVYYGPLA